MPPHQSAADGEARAFRLADLQRLEIRSQRTDIVETVVGVPGRDRHHAVILDPNDLHVMQIEDDDHVLDRVGVAVVVVGTGADPDNATRQAASLKIGLVLVDPEWPGIDPDEVHVCILTAMHRGLESWILAHDLFAGEDLFQVNVAWPASMRSQLVPRPSVRETSASTVPRSARSMRTARASRGGRPFPNASAASTSPSAAHAGRLQRTGSGGRPRRRGNSGAEDRHGL